MESYIRTLLYEKGISLEHSFLIPSDDIFGNHIVPVEVVVEFISSLNKETQLHIKWTLVKIDFNNGDILSYLEYICKGMVNLKFK